jgi:hypothetical protein
MPDPIVTRLPEGAPLRHHLITWPCGGGDGMAWPLDDARLLQAGVALTRFNPGGHGGRTDPFTFEGGLQELVDHVEALGVDPAIPRWGLGHSMGTWALLRGRHALRLHHLFGAAPIADSRRSVTWMQEEGRTAQFVHLFGLPPATRDAVLDLCARGAWLRSDDAFLEALPILEVPTAGMLVCPSFAAFVREVFEPGYNIWPRARRWPGGLTLLPAREDLWYPLDELRREARQHGIPLRTIASADDHLFRGGWQEVVDVILDAMYAADV